MCSEVNYRLGRALVRVLRPEVGFTLNLLFEGI